MNAMKKLRSDKEVPTDIIAKMLDNNDLLMRLFEYKKSGQSNKWDLRSRKDDDLIRRFVWNDYVKTKLLLLQIGTALRDKV